MVKLFAFASVALVVAVAVALFSIKSTDASPVAYQELAARKGFIPVYIRTGDQPLEEISRELAMAFDEHPKPARKDGPMPTDYVEVPEYGDELTRKVREVKFSLAASQSDESNSSSEEVFNTPQDQAPRQ